MFEEMHSTIRKQVWQVRPLAFRIACALALSLLCCGFVSAQAPQFQGVVSIVTNSDFGTVPAIVVDAQGNIYVVDNENEPDIYKLTAAGSVSPLDTGGISLSTLYGLALDGLGNLYIADFDPSVNSLWKVTPNGQATQIATPTASTKIFSVAADAAGNFYYVDFSAETLQGTLYRNHEVVATGISILGNPDGMAVDGAGNVYIVDPYPAGPNGTGAVIKVSAAGAVSVVNTGSIVLGALHEGPGMVAVDGAGNLYIGDGDIVKVTPGGEASELSINGITNFDTRAVFIDPSGDLYGFDYETYQLFKVSQAVNFGSTPLSSATTPIAFTWNVSSADAITSVAAYTNGSPTYQPYYGSPDFTITTPSSCSATTMTCTAQVTFNPSVPGPISGAVLAMKGSNVVSTVYVSGTGVAPQIGFSPAPTLLPNSRGATFAAPSAVAEDGSGTLFIADTGNNRVWWENGSGGNALNTGSLALSGPMGAAVDGIGNVYVAYTGNNRIIGVPSAYITTATPNPWVVNTAGYTLSAPQAIATDGAGSLYIADTGNNRVLKVGTAGVVSQANTLSDDLQYPAGVAVDAAGDVFIADTGDNRIVEVTAPGVVSVLGTGSLTLSGPSSVAVDPAGNIYIADTGNNRIVDVPVAGTAFALSTGAFTLDAPTSIMVDGGGNLFIGDTGNNRVVEVQMTTPPSLDFGSMEVGQPTSPQTVTVWNMGNSPLNLASGANPPYPLNFPENESDVNLCAGGASLAPGAACDVSAYFKPTQQGSNTGSLVLTDNALNASGAAQSIGLSGIGTSSPIPWISSPTPGSTLTSSASFTWNPGTGGATKFVLNVGTTGRSSSNIYRGAPTAANSAAVPILPGFGGTLYVRLNYLLGGTWSYVDYTYLESGTPEPPAMTSPVDGGTVGSSNVAFIWTPSGAASDYVLELSAVHHGGSDVFKSGEIITPSITVPAIPANGGSLFARLNYKVNGVFLCVDYTFAESGTPTSPSLTGPVPGTTLSGGSNLNFTWDPGKGANAFRLELGTTGHGSNDVYDSGQILASSVQVPAVPTWGVILYARLSYKVNGMWSHIDYTYTEAGTPVLPFLFGVGGKANGTNVLFAWFPGGGPTEFMFRLKSHGSTDWNLYDGSPTTATEASVPFIPADGGVIYARLYYLMNGTWYAIEGTYYEDK